MLPSPSPILIGTSGYSYPEWKEAGFYPESTPSGGMLAFYARNFPVTELNYTWYQMPKTQAIERMMAQVPDTFRFTAKLTRKLTHEISPDQWRKDAAQYREGLWPLIQSGQLEALLAQFPPSFKRTPENRTYLARLMDEIGDLPMAVEFRHVSWADPRVYDHFSKRKITLVTVDTPDLPWLFPSIDVVTNPDRFYIRFHGKNKKGWNTGDMQQQFNYDYTRETLSPYAEKRIPSMAEQAKTGLVFFNNHVRGSAPKNARQLIAMLVEQGVLP